MSASVHLDVIVGILLPPEALHVAGQRGWSCPRCGERKKKPTYCPDCGTLCGDVATTVPTPLLRRLARALAHDDIERFYWAAELGERCEGDIDWIWLHPFGAWVKGNDMNHPRYVFGVRMPMPEPYPNGARTARIAPADLPRLLTRVQQAALRLDVPGEAELHVAGWVSW